MYDADLNNALSAFSTIPDENKSQILVFFSIIIGFMIIMTVTIKLMLRANNMIKKEIQGPYKPKKGEAHWINDGGDGTDENGNWHQ